MSYFLVAAGLTWLFGIMKILNLAHGAFFMLGAYIAFTIMGPFPNSLLQFLGVAILAGIALGAIGYLVDLLVFRRLRQVDYHYVLIATFALLMFCEGSAKLIWGVNYNSVMPPPELDRPIHVFGLYLSRYTVFVIVAGLVLFAAVDLLIHRSRAGKIMQAVAADPKMAGLLGINVPMVLSLSAVGAFALAGLAGGFLIANQTLSPYLGTSYLLYAFFAVIIGGLGNVRGAFLASLLLGLVESFNATFASDFPGIAIYFALVAALIFRPTGLLPGAVR